MGPAPVGTATANALPPGNFDPRMVPAANGVRMLAMPAPTGCTKPVAAMIAGAREEEHHTSEVAPQIASTPERQRMQGSTQQAQGVLSGPLGQFVAARQQIGNANLPFPATSGGSSPVVALPGRSWTPGLTNIQEIESMLLRAMPDHYD